MKIDYAVMSADNSHYLEFWPVISWIWEKKLGITPILLYFSNEPIGTVHGRIVHMGEPKENIGITTCWARYWWASQQMDKVCIITDIDMIPLSKDYFVESIAGYNANAYLHLNDCIDSYSRLPSCYHVAKGDVFKQVLQTGNIFSESLEMLLKREFNNKECYDKIENRFWCYDEFWATEKILMSEKKDIFLLKRDMANDRVDRTNWVWDKNIQYVDAHSLRPYKENFSEIHRLISRYHD